MPDHLSNPDKSDGEERQLPTDLVKQFLENQADELTNDKERIELEKQNQKHGFDYAVRALEAQREFTSGQRTQQTLFIKYGFALTVIVLLLLGGFTAVCIFTGNQHILIATLKIIAYVLPSSVGGYFFGHYRGRRAARHGAEDYSEVVEDFE